MSMKNPLTLAGIEPATFRFVRELMFMKSGGSKRRQGFRKLQANHLGQ